MEEKTIVITTDDYKKDECGILILKVFNYDENLYKALDVGKERFYTSNHGEFDFMDEAIRKELRDRDYDFEVICWNFGLYQV